MKPLVVIGGGGHAKVIISVLKKIPQYEILGYVSLEDNGDILGIKYLGRDEALLSLKNKYADCCAVIGIGGVETFDKRKRIKDKLESLSYNLPQIISPDSVVNDGVEIGKGTVVLDGAVINTGCRIGEGVIINTKASVDHDCQLGDFVHVAPGAILCGGVSVGENCLIGAGAVVLQYKVIARDCLIGAGAVVNEDCRVSGRYLGVPAKIKK